MRRFSQASPQNPTVSTNGSAPVTPSSATNLLLAALPQAEYQRLAAHFRPIDVSRSQVLYNAGDSIDRVYFLNGGVVSMTLTSAQGTLVEVGLIDSEGVIGSGTALTDGVTIHQIQVEVPGSGVYMPAAIFREEFKRGGTLQDLVLQHWQFLSLQTSQCALCNRLHTVEERLCRWLLMMHDRVQGDKLDLTQELISHMLGVRRSGVTTAAGILRGAGLISYRRGHITVMDREGLEESACECYQEIRRHGQRLLHWGGHNL